MVKVAEPRGIRPQLIYLYDRLSQGLDPTVNLDTRVLECGVWVMKERSRFSTWGNVRQYRAGYRGIAQPRTSEPPDELGVLLKGWFTASVSRLQTS